MALTDPIADGLTKIANASRAQHLTVEVRASRLFERILDVLKQEGFIRTYKTVGQSPSVRMLRVYLKYASPAHGTSSAGLPSSGGDRQAWQIGKKTPAITRIVRVSKPGVRRYRNAKNLPRILGGLGVAILSTSKGLMTERDAYRQRIGGEVLCYVW